MEGKGTKSGAEQKRPEAVSSRLLRHAARAWRAFGRALGDAPARSRTAGEKKAFFGGDNLPRTPMSGRAKAFPARRFSSGSLPELPVAGGSGLFLHVCCFAAFLWERTCPGPCRKRRARKALSCRMAAVCGNPRHAACGAQPPCERALPDPLTQAACFPAVAGKQV